MSSCEWNAYKILKIVSKVALDNIGGLRTDHKDQILAPNTKLIVIRFCLLEFFRNGTSTLLTRRTSRMNATHGPII
jgi:hypothetical protein